MAALQPGRAALKVPRGRKGGRIDYLSLSFEELAEEVAGWQRKLGEAGVVRGDRVLVMVKQGLPLIAAVFALFRLGAVPVVIDPGMGMKAFLSCVERTRPRVLLGIPLAMGLGWVCRGAFRSVEVRVWASGSTTARVAGGGVRGGLRPGAVASEGAETAAILFTSGSTGAPKGVVYTHGMFAAQVALVKETYGIEPGEVDLPMLPIFALFNPALGMTTVVPEMDPKRPGEVDPAKVVQAILQEGVTNSFGSPTLWGRIARYCHQTKTVLPGMRRVLCAGAPVPPWLWGAMEEVLPNGELHSPYGATEVLPVSSIRAGEVLAETGRLALAGAGTCVGRVLAANEVRILALTEGPISSMADVRRMPVGEVGEIVVSGPTVTREYDGLPEATAGAKISEGGGRVWHRMGDCGYLDEGGRLWFCGRKVEAVRTVRGLLFTEQVEPIFSGHPEVRRCALIGIGSVGGQRPALVVEPVDAGMVKDSEACRRLARELRTVAKGQGRTEAIKVFYFHPRLPVDVRHNAKIHRLTLAAWARNGGVGYESDPKR